MTRGAWCPASAPRSVRAASTPLESPVPSWSSGLLSPPDRSLFLFCLPEHRPGVSAPSAP